MSFTKASAEAGGDDIIFAMHKNGKLEMRTHPNLVGTDDIKDPRNQQVAYTKEYWDEKKTKSEEDKIRKRDRQRKCTEIHKI